VNSNIRVGHGSGGDREHGTMPFVLQSAWKISSILTRHHAVGKVDKRALQELVLARL